MEPTDFKNPITDNSGLFLGRHAIVSRVDQPKHKQLNTPHCQDNDYIINTCVYLMYTGTYILS